MDPITEVRFNRITALIRGHESANPGIPITLDRSLESFGFDELDQVELIMDIEDEFELRFEDMFDPISFDQCKTVGDLVALVGKELEKC